MATQQQQAAHALRELILSGELAAGARVTEVALAERLGLSRTPVRHALTVVESQGLLDRSTARGYTVSSFSAADIEGALAVRGILEGLAVRTLAERGCPASLREALAQCLAAGDRALATPSLAEADEAAFLETDLCFHTLLAQAAHNHALDHLLAQQAVLPLADALPLRQSLKAAQLPRREQLQYLQRQHHALVAAVDERDGARAEALMREHLHAAPVSRHPTRERP